jgi:hypothetical protein
VGRLRGVPCAKRRQCGGVGPARRRNSMQHAAEGEPHKCSPPLTSAVETANDDRPDGAEPDWYAFRLPDDAVSQTGEGRGGAARERILGGLVHCALPPTTRCRPSVASRRLANSKTGSNRVRLPSPWLPVAVRLSCPPLSPTGRCLACLGGSLALKNLEKCRELRTYGADSGSGARKGMRVQFPPFAQ